MSAADDFLNGWTLNREDKSPLARADAERIAAQWIADAAENGISRGALERAAGDDLSEYLLRTYGEAGPSADAI